MVAEYMNRARGPAILEKIAKTPNQRQVVDTLKEDIWKIKKELRRKSTHRQWWEVSLNRCEYFLYFGTAVMCCVLIASIYLSFCSEKFAWDFHPGFNLMTAARGTPGAGLEIESILFNQTG